MSYLTELQDVWSAFLGSSKPPEGQSKKAPATALQIPSFHQHLETTAPRGWNYGARHFRAIAAAIQRCLNGENDRLRIHMPPRHGKTETSTVRLAVYLLLWRPGIKLLITGHSQRFANRLSLKVQEEYIRLGGKLKSGQTAREDWATADGGHLCARGVGNVPTGSGFDAIIIDDPTRDRKQADSRAWQETIVDWYVDGLSTRTAPECFIIAVFTRWNEYDLAGHLKENQEAGGDSWEVLNLPAIDEAGNALWPEVWPVEKLERKRKAMLKRDGERSWLALFQQNPTPASGNVIPVESFRMISRGDLPSGLLRVRAWDVGASENNGDPTSGVRLEFTPDLSFIAVTDVVSGQYGTTDRDAIILATAKADGPDCMICLPQDPGAAGKSQAVYWARMLSGRSFQFIARRPGTTKEVAARPIASQIGQGLVSMVMAQWNGEFKKQLADFPLGSHDDHVDALADAYSVALTLAGQVFDDIDVA
jgi:predicted phage terminase large subunit-like protein